MPAITRPASTHPRWMLIGAALLYWVIARLLPLGGTLLYPLTLFTTWVHEMGHGLAAVLVGGRFQQLLIFSNASGLATTSSHDGWARAAVSAGGLLAPPLLGATILAFAHTPRRARVALAVLAGALILSLALWVRSTAGFIAMPLVAGLLGWAATWAPGRRVLLAQFLGVVLALDTLTRLDYVFTEKVTIGGQDRLSDVAVFAQNAGGHHLLWGILFAVVACGLLALGLWRAWSRPAPLA
jgi:hypothetical protein